MRSDSEPLYCVRRYGKGKRKMISSQETCWTETNNERFDEGYLGGRENCMETFISVWDFSLYDENRIGIRCLCAAQWVYRDFFDFWDNACNVV